LGIADEVLTRDVVVMADFGAAHPGKEFSAPLE
jgi:hypothetical protein